MQNTYRNNLDVHAEIDGLLERKHGSVDLAEGDSWLSLDLLCSWIHNR